MGKQFHSYILVLIEAEYCHKIVWKRQYLVQFWSSGNFHKCKWDVAAVFVWMLSCILSSEWVDKSATGGVFLLSATSQALGPHLAGLVVVMVGSHWGIYTTRWPSSTFEGVRMFALPNQNLNCFPFAWLPSPIPWSLSNVQFPTAEVNLS